MPTYDGIGSSVTHEIEVVGDVFISNVEGGSLSTQVPFEIFSNVSGMVSPPTDSRQVRLRVQPTTEASPDDSYVTDMGIQNTTDNYFFITAPQNTSSVGDQNTFVISKTSNVGIGTTNPTSALHVVGDELITGTLTASNIVGGSPLTITSDQNLQVNSNLTVGTSNLFVDNVAGRVGINTTNPIDDLHVRGGITFQYGNSINATTDSQSWTNNKVLSASWNGTQDITQLWVPGAISASTPRITILSNGRVGIGTDSPLAPIHMSSDNTSLDATDGATFDQYSLILHNTRGGGANGTEIGLCFNHYDSAYPTSSRTPGAAITHERTTSWSKGKLHFKTKQGATESSDCVTAMTINEDGNVGIGTANPYVSFHNSSTRSIFAYGDGSTGSGGFYQRWNARAGGAGRTELINHNGYSTNGGFEFGNIPNGTSSQNFSAFGNWADLYANTFQAQSDFRLKRNIKTIENALDTVSNLNPTTFEINISTEDTEYQFKSGFIAQEVYYDTPELRHLIKVPDDAEPDIETNRLSNYENWGKNKASMDTGFIIPYLVKAIQEQQALIEDLRARIESLENSS